MDFKVSPEEALRKLLIENEFPFAVVMKHGTMTIEYFAPQERDTQTPHRQDEIYVIASGHSSFYRNGERVKCKKGDILFVPAGMKHYFENFTDDFATWVIFYGPDGGEKENAAWMNNEELPD
jgi:mannose-6-phosphate isomerase-like protein (cupin superfamily)